MLYFFGMSLLWLCRNKDYTIAIEDRSNSLGEIDHIQGDLIALKNWTVGST